MSRREGWVRGSARRRPLPPAPPEPSTSPITNVPVVPFVPARCPACTEVSKVRDYGTHSVQTHIDRYHQCRHCGTKFISRELLPTFH